MQDKFYVRTIIRDDGVRFDFDAKELYLARDNNLLNRASISSSDVEYTDANGGEMIRQRLQSNEQVFNGLIYPREDDYWTLYFKLTSFFLINHYYSIVYKRRDGTLFTQQRAWLSASVQSSPPSDELYSPFTFSMKIGSAALYEYAEDGSGTEIYANSATLPLLSITSGGELWDSTGQVHDEVGSVWSPGDGGVQDINIASVSDVYPLWIIEGLSVNPSLQNNTTDTEATYVGTVAEGQTLVVDFATGEARLDGALVSRNIIGQVSFKPGLNSAGFNSDGGSSESSQIFWNNVIG